MAVERGIIGGVKAATPIAPAALADFHVVVGKDRTHNAVHEILTATPPVPAAQLVHDVKGNLTTNKNGQVYTWDVENRLGTATVPVAPPGDPLVHSYAYDALGRRVSKTVGEVTTTYINNADWQEIAEYQGGNLVQSYIYGTYIDEVLAMVKADGTRYFYSTNDLFSTYALTDSTGGVVERYVYDPYGKVTVLAPDGVTTRTASLYGNTRFHQGLRLDTETGMYYNRRRMLDPVLGRFIGRDPIGYRGGLSLFQYVGSRPSFRKDPLGLMEAYEYQALSFGLFYALGFFPGFGYGFEPWWIGESEIRIDIPELTTSKSVRDAYDAFFASEGKKLCAQKLKLAPKTPCFARIISDVQYGPTHVGPVRAFPDSTTWEAIVGTSTISFSGDAEVFIKRDPSNTPPCCRCSCTVTFTGTARFYDEIDANSWLESYRKHGFSSIGAGAWHFVEGVFDIFGDKIFDADFNVSYEWSIKGSHKEDCSTNE